MSEWYDRQKKPSSNFRKLLQEHIDKKNPRRTLKAEELKRLTKIEAIADKSAKYSIFQTKVDVESLKSCLMAYDLKQKGTDVLEIGLQVKWISGAEAKDLIEDGRRKGKEVDSEKLAELSENNSKEYGRLLAKAQAVVSKRLKGNLIDSDDKDTYLKEMCD